MLKNVSNLALKNVFLLPNSIKLDYLKDKLFMVKTAVLD